MPLRCVFEHSRTEMEEDLAERAALASSAAYDVSCDIYDVGGH